MRRLDQGTGTASIRCRAQRWADDVVLAAALFKPNAAGSFEFGLAGFAQRQLLKARGVYLAERVVIAVTPIDVYALELVFGRWILRQLGRWRRTDLEVTAIGMRDVAAGSQCPALKLANRTREVAELRVVHPDDEAAYAIKLLLGAGLPAASA